MTATDELWRLLDERGVKYEWNTESFAFDGIDGVWWIVEGRHDRNTVDLYAPCCIPEQAIAATLGNTRAERTCHVKSIERLENSFGFKLSCGHSMVNPFNDRPDYCPWCGAKVKDE